MNQAIELANRSPIKPFIKFVRETVEDLEKTRISGRYVGVDVDMVHITPAYTRDVVKHVASKWFDKKNREVIEGKERQDWLNDWKKMYEMFKNGQEVPLEGYPIRGWGIISPAMQENLTRMNILTVESLSRINGEGMDRLGMGAVDLKNKAIAWLAQLNDAGKMTIEMSALQQENAVLKSSIESLQRQVEQLMRNQPSQNDAQMDVPHGTIGISDILDAPDLNAQYEAKFGKKPHHLMKPETIAAKLAE